MIKDEIRIPTLAGLVILALGIIGGVVLVSQKQLLTSRAGGSLTPKNITVTNISTRSVAIYWTTDTASPGFVQFGVTNSLLDRNALDSRDSNSPAKHSLHFVSLSNLYPNTEYYYKIYSSGDSFPDNQSLKFKTSALDIPAKSYPAVTGNILEANLSPIDEALVTLEIPGAQTVSTISKLSGSFNLGLADLKTADLSTGFAIVGPNLEAHLKVFNNQSSSSITLSLPLEKTNLPTIILGQNRDLTGPTPVPNFDINLDSKINQLDRSSLITIIQSGKYKVEVDLNRDGRVDQSDLDLLDRFIASSKNQIAPPLVSPTPTPH